MKFNPKKEIEEGIMRIVKRFAFFPITEIVIYNQEKGWAKNGQTRWLETIYIKQKLVKGCAEAGIGVVNFWMNLEFVTKEEYEKFK